MRTRQRTTVTGGAVGLGAVLFLVLTVAAPVGTQEQPLTDSFTFAVFGDNRPGSATAPQPKVFRKIAYEIGELQPDFVVGLGDYILGSNNEATVRRQWAGFFNAMVPMRAKKNVPFVPVVGNHDVSGSLANEVVFSQYLHYLFYSFDWGKCHFVTLDSEVVGQDGRIMGHQLDWLKSDLAANRQAPLTFVFVHRPLYPVSVHKGQSLDIRPEERDALHRLFLDNAVDCVFAGHEHLFNLSQHDGLTYIISGGAGAPLYSAPEQGDFYHYLVVKVQNGKYRIEVRRPKQPY